MSSRGSSTRTGSGSSGMAATATRVRKYWELYLFLLLPVCYVVLFHYVPMLGLQIAFKKYNMKGGIWGSPWVGLKQFQKFFSSYQFKRVVPNTIVLSFYGLVSTFLMSIIFALMLNSVRRKGVQKFIQNLSYIPHFISTVVMVGMLIQIFNTRVGMYGQIGRLLMGKDPQDLLASPVSFRHLYVWSGVWQHLGWNSIIYIAALAGVSPDLHEAAEIDGASRFQRVLHIDLPSILPTATILLILNVGSILSVGFEKVYLMQNNANLSASEVISTYVYKVAMTSGTGDFSYATAIGIFNSVINLLLLTAVNAIAGKMGETSLW